jgi:hemolysin activation/secretion protein
MEQFSVGGYQSVRGYREDQLVRDNGLASSLELRLPIWSDPALGLDVQLAPFCDVGHSWNTKRDEQSPLTIGSVGVGLRTFYKELLRGEIYWGHRLESVSDPGEHDLQDEGVHFAVTGSF